MGEFPRRSDGRRVFSAEFKRETVLYTRELGFLPITTPAYSPQSNGMAEAFVNTMKRDYVSQADLSDAETVLAQVASWIDDYNHHAPHSSQGQLTPIEFRARQYGEKTTGSGPESSNLCV